MGILDNLAGGFKNLLDNEQGQGNLLESIGSLLNNPQTGGLGGLVQSFKDNGLENIVSSWVGTGNNLPISSEQIKSVLGSERVQLVASKLGIDPDVASQHLAEYLPKVIDKLTPEGSLPASQDIVSKGLGMLKGSLFGN
jgi:uncharacterized protein YidB (DUF937 family)